MPRLLDNKPFPVVLASDQDKPEDGRPTPTFLGNCLPASKWLDYATEHDELQEDLPLDEAVQRRYDLTRKLLAGWENLTDANGEPITYDPARLEDVVDPLECIELLRRLLSNGHNGY